MLNNSQPSTHMEIKKEKFLNIEEADNLQDMINYAASISVSKIDSNTNKEIVNDFPVESLYAQVLNTNLNGQLTNEKLDSSINEILKKYSLLIISKLNIDLRILFIFLKSKTYILSFYPYHKIINTRLRTYFFIKI